LEIRKRQAIEHFKLETELLAARLKKDLRTIFVKLIRKLKISLRKNRLKNLLPKSKNGKRIAKKKKRNP